MLSSTRLPRCFLLGLLLITLPLLTTAQVNISGKPGLMYIPTARSLQDGDFLVGYSFNPIRYAVSGINNPGSSTALNQNSENIFYGTLCVLPRLEMSVTLLRPNGYLPLQARGIGDRQFDFKYLALTERANRPAIAVILSAPFGLNNSLITHALVATKNVRLNEKITAELTVGYGSPYYYDKSGGGDKYDFFGGYELRDKRKNLGQYLTGPFGGAAIRFSNKAGVMAEWDSRHLNIGGYATLFNRWTVQAGVINFDQIHVGTSYAVSLRKLTKRITAPAPTSEQRDDRTLLNYENLTVDSTAKQVVYDQRINRNPLIGMLELKKSLPQTDSLDFVPRHLGIPIARYRLSPTIQAEPLTPADRQVLRQRAPFNWRRYKADFRLQPEVIARFGFKSNPFETKTNLLLQTQLVLWPGMALNAGVTLALINDLDNERKGIRPGPIYLNQFLALGRRNFLSMSLGTFYNNQYGFNAQYRWADLRKPWSFGIESSLTGFYYFPARSYYYELPNQFMLFADVAYRLPVHAITVKLSGGQYLDQQRGARLDLIRQFANVEVGAFATKLTKDYTFGFNLAIPVPPGRLAQGKHARLRTSEEFRWEYNYNGSANVGAPYRIGTRLDALLRQYHQDYLRSQVTRSFAEI